MERCECCGEVWGLRRGVGVVGIVYAKYNMVTTYGIIIILRYWKHFCFCYIDMNVSVFCHHA